VSLEEDVGRLLAARGETLAVAESVTGGLVGSRITDVSGSSRYFLESIVAYADSCKVKYLGVRKETLAAKGAVSEEVAREMAEGARARSGATWAVATTGIAGPLGATPGKPLGLVYVAVAGPRGTRVARHQFRGDRLAVKSASAEAALRMLQEELLVPGR
jgi:PncC family amidohydrolase